MRYATAVLDDRPRPVLLLGERVLPFERLAADTGRRLPASLLDTVLAGDGAVRDALAAWRRDVDASGLPAAAGVRFSLPFRPPGKIWGIGLNYRDHAADLDEQVPPAPASFNKPASCVVGPGESILLPAVSERVTAEAELGVVLGRRTAGIGEDDALGSVFAFTTVLDMTAEDILRVNPRFLTRAKSFDGFFSFGPVLVTPDEVDDLPGTTVRLLVSGERGPSNQVRNMTYGVERLIAFHSQGMTWEPGDILSTGTPGAVPIHDGDVVTCVVDGVGRLECPVRSAA